MLGVVNLSPESPNRDSIVADATGAITRARRLVAEGAAVIDIGAQSSHYAAPLLTVEDEIARLLPALRALKAAGLLVSVDTWRAPVAAAALAAGADLINDSDGFQDPAIIETLAAARVPVIIPFLNGRSPHDLRPFDFADPLGAMLSFFERALARAEAAGLRDVILDPGTGYVYPGVSAEAKLAYQRIVYRDLGRIKALGRPVLVALPRKPDAALTAELVQSIIEGGAEWVRAHEPSKALTVHPENASVLGMRVTTSE